MYVVIPEEYTPQRGPLILFKLSKKQNTEN